MDLGVEPMLADGRLVDVFPDWPDERFPLYALHPSRRHVPAKTRAFIDFVATLLQPPPATAPVATIKRTAARRPRIP